MFSICLLLLQGTHHPGSFLCSAILTSPFLLGSVMHLVSVLRFICFLCWLNVFKAQYLICVDLEKHVQRGGEIFQER